LVRKPPLVPSIRFLLLTLMVNAIGFGIIVPVTPQLVMELGQADLAQATVIGGGLAVSYALCQFICGPTVGNLSDRFGRRPILLFSLLGFALEFLLMALAPTLLWLFVARMLSGVFGATQGPAQSAIADMTGPEDRSRIFGLLGAAFGIGFVLGPAIGGFLSDYGNRLPFYVAAGLAAGNAVYGYWAFKESLTPENRRPFEWRRANPLGALLQVRKLKGVLPLALIYFVWQLASIVYPMVWSYFAMAQYGWSGKMVGVSLAAIGICMAAANIIVMPRLAPRLGERKTALVGMIFGALAMFAYACAPYGWMVFPIGIIMAMQSMVHPSLTAMLSRKATPETQGEMQGFSSSVMALGAILAPLIFNPVQGWFTSPAAPFQFAGAALFVAGFLALLATFLLWRQRDA
jgi:MFS transporter, DHA1 family, tetracycline resistance protein